MSICETGNFEFISICRSALFIVPIHGFGGRNVNKKIERTRSTELMYSVRTQK